MPTKEQILKSVGMTEKQVMDMALRELKGDNEVGCIIACIGMSTADFNGVLTLYNKIRAEADLPRYTQKEFDLVLDAMEENDLIGRRKKTVN